MLVLGLKNREFVTIAGVGRITLCRSQNGQARIGFEIEKAFKIVRDEVLARDANDFHATKPSVAPTTAKAI